MEKATDNEILVRLSVWEAALIARIRQETEKCESIKIEIMAKKGNPYRITSVRSNFNLQRIDGESMAVD